MFQTKGSTVRLIYTSVKMFQAALTEKAPTDTPKIGKVQHPSLNIREEMPIQSRDYKERRREQT